MPLENLGLKFPSKNHTVEVTIEQWFKFVGPCVMDLSMTLIGQNQKIVKKITTRRRCNRVHMVVKFSGHEVKIS